METLTAAAKIEDLIRLKYLLNDMVKLTAFHSPTDTEDVKNALAYVQGLIDSARQQK